MAGLRLTGNLNMRGLAACLTENVYDSPTGRFLLIPQGAKLIGTYDSQVSFGQSRVLLVPMTRLHGKCTMARLLAKRSRWSK